MEIKSILIKDTTREERKQIVEESFGNISASCDGCMAGLTEMYQEYIDGTKVFRICFHIRGTFLHINREICQKILLKR